MDAISNISKFQELLSLHATAPQKFRDLLTDSQQTSDEMLLKMCQSYCQQSEEATHQAIEWAFEELIENRYRKVIYNACYSVVRKKGLSTRKRQDQAEIDFYDYVVERLHTKLGMGFFLEFRSQDDFAQAFQQTLVKYIKDYLWKDYLRQENRKRTHCVLDDERLEDTSSGHSTMSEEMDRETPLSFLQEQLSRCASFTKQILFELFCALPTRWVRESATDAKIHDCTCQGQQEPNRSLGRTQAVLDIGCEENRQRVDSRSQEEHDIYEMLTELYIAKLQKLRDMQQASQNDNLPKLEKAQKHYSSKHAKTMELRGKLNLFFQLSSATIALILNTTETFCYKLKHQAKTDWLDIFKHWLQEREDWL
jgi:hypothetical protein